MHSSLDSNGWLPDDASDNVRLLLLRRMIAQQRDLQSYMESIELRVSRIESPLLHEDFGRTQNEEEGKFADALESVAELIKGQEELKKNVAKLDADVRELKGQSTILEPQVAAVHACQVDRAEIHGSNVTEQECNAKFTYSLEENLYGVIFTQMFQASSKFRLWIFFVYFLFYASVITGTAMISWDMHTTLGTFMEAVDDLCSKGDLALDCRPRGYSDLLDFAHLDEDGNNEWSFEEAKRRDMLQQFQAVHNMALEMPELQEMLSPPVRAQMNLLCSFMISISPMPHAEYFELVADKVHSVMHDVIQEFDEYCPHDKSSQEYELCIMLKLCPALGMTTDIAPVTSRSGYISGTRVVSIFPRSYFELISKVIGAPCRLIRPELCSNAESKGLLSVMPLWQNLSPADRIRECEDFVSRKCPKIFGVEYGNSQEKARLTCGRAELSPETVVLHALDEPNTPPVQRGCSDNSALANKIMANLMTANPSLKLLILGFLNASKQSASLPDTMDCAFVHVLNWCNLVIDAFVDKFDKQSRVQVASLVGTACPQTCCMSSSIGCPTICLAEMLEEPPQEQAYGSSLGHLLHERVIQFKVKQNIAKGQDDQIDQRDFACLITVQPDGEIGEFDLRGNLENLEWIEMDFGSVRCMGSACTRLRIQKGTSNLLTFEKVGFAPQDSAKIVVRSQRKLQVMISHMVMGGDDLGICNEAYLAIDGQRYCQRNMPKEPVILHRHAVMEDLHEIIYVNERRFGECKEGWSFTIGEAAQLSSHTALSVRFEVAEQYIECQRFRYLLFFGFVVFLWTAHVLKDTELAFRMGRFTIFCSSCPLSKEIRWFIVWCICLPRVALGVWVWAAGIALLLSAPSYTDVVLNGVALAFMFDASTILYCIAAPINVRSEISDASRFYWGSGPASALLQVGHLLHNLVPAVFAILITALLFWINSPLAEKLECACYAEGDRCLDAVLQ